MSDPLKKQPPYTDQEVADLPPMLSIQQAARVLNIGPATCYRMVQKKTFPSRVVEMGRLVKIPKADLLKVMETGENTGQEPGDDRR